MTAPGWLRVALALAMTKAEEAVAAAAVAVAVAGVLGRRTPRRRLGRQPR